MFQRSLFLAITIWILISILLTVVVILNTREKSGLGERYHGQNTSVKPFIYLLQTESCLPLNLASAAEIGNTSTCRCDVIVLSYREECKEHTPSHINYMFQPQSTIPSGRNLLYYAARTRKSGYHYYILLDDDVSLKFNRFTPPEMKELQPFRVMEDWLLDYEPVVGVLNYDEHDGARVILERRRRICGMNATATVLPTILYDQLLNAYHYKAIDHILPYPTLYDMSWQVPAKRVMSAVELKFRGQGLLFAPVTVCNKKHRSYPRNAERGVINQIWRKFIEEIQLSAPTIYQNQSLFKTFKQGLWGYVNNSRTYCMDVIPHQPIVPFAHFNQSKVSL